ncbi:MAG: tetratricopeptide repeat protein [Synechococcales cyanobacterium T60_A2020_003]|nr:tetratricopeptide repeat protein [Synechococcales cyanobacterium T60_A2020_003]
MSRSSPQINTDRPLGGRYKIVGQLGAGGFGQTFIAEDVHLPGHPRCVIKQLKPQSTSSKALEMARRCFHTEAQVLYQLGIHEQIPRLLAHFEEDKEFYLAQEFIEGEPLTPELVSGRPWSEARAVRLLRDTLEVLAFVHQKQVIHRDLKPSNLIRRRLDHRLVLIDFGAVKQASTLADPETGVTDVTISIGTQGYMPSEQVAGKPRFSSDVYAVGILGIQALTGIHPRCLGEDERGEIAWWHRAEHVRPELAEILNQMVRYDFRDRYPTAVEALEALDALGVIEETGDPPCHDPILPDTIVQIRSGSGGTAANGDRHFNPDEWTAESDPVSTALWVPTTADLVPPPDGINRPVHPVHGALVGEQVDTTPRQESSAVKTIAFTPEQVLRSRPVLTVAAAAALTVGFALTITRPEWFVQLVQATPHQYAEIGLGSIEQPADQVTTAIDPPTPDEVASDLVREGDALMEQQAYEDALKVYSNATKVVSDFADAYIGRCRALNALGRPEEAIVSCNDALAYRPGDAHALLNKGNAFVQQGRLIEALKLYEDALYYDSTIVDAWVKRGATLQALGRSAEALSSIDQAIALNRDQPEAWSVRGFALWNLQRYEEAVVSMDKALQLNPNDQKVKDLRENARQLLGR